MRFNLSCMVFEVYNRRQVLRQLVMQQLTLRYRRTVLGFLWTLINPLLMMSVMAIVFSTIFKSELKTFAVFLFSGMIPWTFFSSVATQSGAAFINNEGLIKKIYLPKAIFPLSITLSLLIDSVLSFLALFIIMLCLGAGFSVALLFVPISFLLLFLFSFGIGLVMSIATVFFRDLQHVMQIIIQGLFFLTPVLYKHEMFTGYVGILIRLNPVVPFIEIFRAPLYEGVMPSVDVICQASIVAVVTFVLGLGVFLSQEKKIVFRL